jgi:hypothetical protein
MPAKVSRLLRHGASTPALAVFHSLNLQPIERRLYTSHLRSKVDHSSRLPSLSNLEAETVRELDREGVFVTSLATLGLSGTSEMIAAGTEISVALANGSRGPRSRSWKSSSAAIAEAEIYRPLFQWGLHPSLLKIVEGYLGLPPAYDGPKVAYTPADGRQAGTRLWHRDREDRRMMKIAVYLTDVPDSGGPLQCLKREVYDGPVNRDFSYPVLTHAQLERKLGRPIVDDDITSCTGPAGTVVFMDTARLYHRGKPALDTARRAVFQSYFSRNPRHPFFCERSDLSRAEMAHFATELSSPAQRNAVCWRDVIGWKRFVPGSAV